MFKLNFGHLRKKGMSVVDIMMLTRKAAMLLQFVYDNFLAFTDTQEP